MTADATFRNQLTVLWAAVALNMVAADVLSLYLPGTAEEVLAFMGSEAGVRWAMLFGAVLYQIPIGMTVASQFLGRIALRRLSLVAVVLSAVPIVGAGSASPSYITIAAIELLLLLATVLHVRRDPGAAQTDADSAVPLFRGSSSPTRHTARSRT